MKAGTTWTADDVRTLAKSPTASAEVRRLNPGIFGVDPLKPLATEIFAKAAQRLMNKTETKFSDLLEARRRAREITGWKYEAIRLKWGEDEDGQAMRYMADFTIFENDGSITLAEVKNVQIWKNDLTRFKGCRAEWAGYFKFQMWQLTKCEWRRVQ